MARPRSSAKPARASARTCWKYVMAKMCIRDRHYTAPGDVVFDGFCGTGMTGVAAQLCGDRRAGEGLGYRVDGDGVVYDGAKAISRLGARRAVLNDLSPAASTSAREYSQRTRPLARTIRCSISYAPPVRSCLLYTSRCV